MKKLILNNVAFDFDLGCKVARLKYDECPQQFEAISDIWEDIVPANFEDIARLQNLEQRRIGINALGLERLISQVNPTLLNSTTIKKSNSWINEFGVLESFEFEDTYELYEVKGSVFSQGLSKREQMQDCHYLRFKDTSTDRVYLLWVNLESVYDTNIDERRVGSDLWQGNSWKERVNSIMAIAWSITTNVPIGHIEEIHRQGDCIMILPKGEYEPLIRPRHLTEVEYRELMCNES